MKAALYFIKKTNEEEGNEYKPPEVREGKRIYNESDLSVIVERRFGSSVLLQALLLSNQSLEKSLEYNDCFLLEFKKQIYRFDQGGGKLLSADTDLLKKTTCRNSV